MCINAWPPIAVVTPDGLAPHRRGTPIPRNEITHMQVLPGRRIPYRPQLLGIDVDHSGLWWSQRSWTRRRRCDLSRLAWVHPICIPGTAGLDDLEIGEELARSLGLRKA